MTDEQWAGSPLDIWTFNYVQYGLTFCEPVKGVPSGRYSTSRLWKNAHPNNRQPTKRGEKHHHECSPDKVNCRGSRHWCRHPWSDQSGDWAVDEERITRRQRAAGPVRLQRGYRQGHRQVSSSGGLRWVPSGDESTRRELSALARCALIATAQARHASTDAAPDRALYPYQSLLVDFYSQF